MDQVQGDKIVGESPKDDDFQILNTVELRRRVLRHLCIICDFQKGDLTVTAIAANTIHSGPRYWLATNGQVDKFKIFLLGVLDTLEKRSFSARPKGLASRFKDEFFETLVAFQRPRVRGYWKLSQTGTEKERENFPHSSPSPRC